MEFYHLRSFVAVAQTGNLTQAAKRLYSTPPAISAHIKTLEEELSTPLFIRSSKGMLLTEKGKILLVKAQKTLDSALDLVNLAANNQHEIIGTFNLGINVDPDYIKLPELAQNIQENCPGISLTIHQQSSGKTIEDVREHQLDGGFIYGEVPDDFIGINLLEEQITTIAPNSFDCSQAVTQHDLTAFAWIMMGDYCPFDLALTKQLGDNISSVLKTSDDGTRLALVQKGLGLSFLEKKEALIAQKEKTIQIIPSLDFAIPLQYIIAKNRLNDPVVTALTNAIKALWKISE